VPVLLWGPGGGPARAGCVLSGAVQRTGPAVSLRHRRIASARGWVRVARPLFLGLRRPRPRLAPASDPQPQRGARSAGLRLTADPVQNRVTREEQPAVRTAMEIDSRCA
jgi:hypothetical protein